MVDRSTRRPAEGGVDGGASSGRLHVCFVCSGNICRSPMAALVLRSHLEQADLAEGVTVSSVGMGPWHVGDPIDPRAGATLRAHGYPTEHTARQIDEHHIAADLLLAADSGHLRAVRNKVADPTRVHLLREFDPNAPAGAEVGDPYYGGDRGFDDVLATIEACVPNLLDWVREQR